MTACAKPATGGAPDISFLATPEQARHAVIHVIAGLADAGLEQGRLCDIELALAEVVNNIVEHGYAGLPAGAIRITCTHGSQCMNISVCDQGHCIPNGLPPGTAPDLNVPLADLPEGGFGWMLIRTLATGLSYTRDGEQNRLDMQFSLENQSD